MELIINHNSGNNIFDILQKFESLTQSEKKMSPYSSICWKLVPSLKTLSPEYFNCLPPLTEIETEQTEPPTAESDRTQIFQCALNFHVSQPIYRSFMVIFFLMQRSIQN